MANRRIRDLGTSSPPVPEDAVFPLDAASLPEAVRATLPDLADAVSQIILPDLVPDLLPDDPAKAAQNTAAIAAKLAEYAASGNRKGILRLPRGLFWVSQAIT